MSLTNSANWMYSSGAKLFDYEIGQSARMTSDSSSYLQRTPSSTGNQRTWTFSCWMKRTELNGGGERIFGAGDDLVSPGNHNNTVTLYFDNHKLRFRQESGGSPQFDLMTNSFFRDMGAWYHIVAVYDSTNGTSGDRARMYVNGERITDLSTNDPDPGSSTVSNCMRSGHIMRIGRSTGGYHNHNLAEVHWVDGQALDPTYFGESKDDIWIPKEYTGSHGTNGVHLTFSNSGSMGADSSGNGNTFSTGGLASTDQILDSPTTNFCIWNDNALRAGGGTSLEKGALYFRNTQHATYSSIGSTHSFRGGKFYFEYRPTRGNSGSPSGSHPQLYFTDRPVLTSSAVEPDSSGATNLSNILGTFDGDGGTYMVAVDMVNGYVYRGRNGSWSNGASASNIAAGNGTGAVGTMSSAQLDLDLFVTVMLRRDGSECNARFNFGQDSTFAGAISAGGNSDSNGIGDFKYAPPTDFLALCSANLPADIDNADGDSAQDNFSQVLFNTQSGSYPKSKTGVGFQPDFVWGKSRNQGYNHYFFDVVRGTGNKSLRSPDVGTEGDGTTLTSFDSDGFTLGAGDALGYTNAVFWNWKAGGSGVTNTSGSVTSTVSANPTAGFSIVNWSAQGNYSNYTVGHGLGKAPKLIIAKNRNINGGPWYSYTTGADGTYDRVTLNNNDSKTDAQFGQALPTSTVFTGTSNAYYTTGSLIAYCFADVAGYQKCGSYRGNGSSDGSFVYTGFRPAFLMVKSYTSTEHWNIPVFTSNFNGSMNTLSPNLTNAERGMNQNPAVDFMSNGFKIQTSDGNYNASGTGYLYLAIAAQPFKYANAR